MESQSKIFERMLSHCISDDEFFYLIDLARDLFPPDNFRYFVHYCLGYVATGYYSLLNRK